MAFFSLMLAKTVVKTVIAAIFLGFLFLVGAILLIVGIVRKRKPQNAGKKSPTACIVSGAVFLLPPVGTAVYLAVSLAVSLFTATFGNLFFHVTDRWRSGQFVGDTRAVSEAIEELLSSAERGDRASFEKMFPTKFREREDFEKTIDAFWESYPSGLALCEREGGMGGSMRSGYKATASASYTCFLDGEWYYMGLEICYGDSDAPEEVGVTFFCIENLEAYALDRDYGDHAFLVCEIKDESDVTARLIDGRGYVFTPTPDRSITVEEMKGYLTGCEHLSDLSDRIGKPNASRDSRSSASSDYYYELVPENGEPRYVCIHADRSRIYWTHFCSDVGRLPD